MVPSRSKLRVVMATYQPRFTSPMTFSLGTRTLSKYSSLKWWSPTMLMMGRMVMPGVLRSTRKKVMPRCFGASGSVRARRNIQSERWASLDHIFWPVIR